MFEDIKKKFDELLKETNAGNYLHESHKKEYEKMVDDVLKEKDKYISSTVGKNKLEIDLSRFGSGDIKKIAEKILEEDYVGKKEKAKGSLENTLARQEEKKDRSENYFRENLDKVNEKAETDKNELKDKSLKNNVARSSANKLMEEEIANVRNGAEKTLSDKRDAEINTADTISKNAQEEFDRTSQSIEDEYDYNLDEKINQLYGKKHSPTKFDLDRVNKEKELAYSNNLIKILADFLSGLEDKDLARKAIVQNDFILKSTTKEERDALLGMFA